MTPTPTYTEALVELGEKIDCLADMAGRQEEILEAVNRINGYVRTHGKILAANKQWVEGHKQEHQILDDRVQTLSGRLWTLGGGGGLLGMIAMVLQFLGN